MSLFKPENMTIAEIIEKLQEAVDLGDSPHRGLFGTFIRKEYLVEAIEALKAHPDAQPNEPLTLEEMRGMEGQPVWVKVIDHTFFADKEDDFDGWGMCRSSWVRVWDGKRADIVHVDYEFETYGKEWLAYRRPPKED